ncbi:MAG TPA: ABC transporter permease, partial [Candidatus Sulfopaludibacter sp.]|nr:ABC transporter permease [Candidatus Sulfopaludibacter sp.]
MRSVRYALRGFRRSPEFALTAILTLALGIGACTAIFSVVDRILFRSLPYPHPDRLVSFGMYVPSADKDEFLMVGSLFRFRREQTPFSEMAAFNFVQDCDVTERHPERIHCARVDAGFLPMLGMQPIAGRWFTAAEDEPNAPKVALISYAWWQARFAGDRGAVGKSIVLDGRPTTIAGVLPREFELPALNDFQVIVPAALTPSPAGMLDATRVFARLKPGVTIEQAAAAMRPLLEAERPNIPAEFRKEIRLAIRPLRDRQIEDIGRASWILLGAVLVVLLIACGNVANLLLARSAGRRRELAIRRALGAGRVHLLRQALAESLLLAGMGAIAGCALGWMLLRFFVRIAPP